jgi:phosphotransferase family enzyme
MDAVADRVDELTAAWLTGALQSRGHDFTVETVAAEAIGTGQMGATYRLRLGYAGLDGPPTLIAKLATGEPASRTLIAPGYAAEAGFYRELAPRLDVRTPRCWYVAITDDRTSFTLLLDDVAPATPGVQAESCSIAQARASIANLVGLHAPLWNDPQLHDLDFLMRPDPSRTELLGQALASATAGFIERYEAQLGDGAAETLREAARRIGAWQMARLEPFAVIHGDYRLDNLLFAPSGGDVVAVDWQTAGIGPPLRDVAYFLGTCLDPDPRRKHEQELVAGYHAALVACGVTGYDGDRCWLDYRLGQLQAPMVTVLGCMYARGVRSDRSDAMFLAMARRSCAAIRDLGSLELV